MHALILAAALLIEPKALETLVDRVVTAEMQKQKIPGAAFILVQDGRVVLAKGYGLADVARKKPVTPDTIFQIGSITKVFTGVAVVQLAERGQLDLNADVNRYLKTTKVPPYKSNGSAVTAKHLLTHTAGFDELRGRMLQSADERVQPLDRFLAGRLVRVHPPGELTSYSSFGIALAGLLVEDVSGLPFERYLAANIWAPLKMNHTYITIPDSFVDEVALAYEDEVIPFERYHTPPASSISSSANDMGRFMISLLGQPNSELFRQHVTMHPRLPGFGYTFQLADTNGQRIAEHGGNIGGFHSLMTLLPDHGVGFYVVAHREGADLRSPLRKAILDRWFPNPRPAPPPVADAKNAARLKRFAGTYRGSIWCHTCPFDRDRVQDVRVTVNADGSLNVWDERWIEVEPRFFRSPDGKRRIGFAEDAKGNITALTSGSWMVLERLPDR